MWTLICITTKNMQIQEEHRLVSPVLKFENHDDAISEIKRDMADAIEGDVEEFLEDHIQENESEVFVYNDGTYEYLYVIQKVAIQ